MKVIISASAVRSTVNFEKDIAIAAPASLEDALNKVAGSYNPTSNATSDGFCRFRILSGDTKVSVKGFRTLPVKVLKATTERKTEKSKTLKVVKATLECNGKRKTLDFTKPKAEVKKRLISIINSWYKDEVFGPNQTKFKPIKE